MIGIVSKTTISDPNFLASLSHDTKSGIKHAVIKIGGRRETHQMQPWQRFFTTVLGEEPDNPINKFATIGVEEQPFPVRIRVDT